MLEIKRVHHTGTPALPVDGTGDPVELRATTGKGYSINDSSLAAAVKNLEGSVCGDVWTVITAISGDAQGAIADQYHFVRIVLTTYASGSVVVHVADPRQE
jgi:hypothetical protein